MASEDSTRASRSSARKELFGETYHKEHEFVTRGKLQSGTFVMGRMLDLCKTAKGKAIMSREDASRIVAQELRSDWIEKNVYPLEERSVARKIKTDYETFLSLRKSERDQSRKRSEKWYEKAKEFNDRMSKRAYDIRTHNVAYQKKLETDCNVKMTAEDELFYRDNCHGAYMATCTATVPKAWSKKRKRDTEREKSFEKRKAEMESVDNEQEKIRKEEFQQFVNENVESTDTCADPTYDLPQEPLYSPLSRPLTTPKTDRKTRSSSSEKMRVQKEPSFPKVNIRDGPRKIKEKIVRCTVQCLAKYKVTPQDLTNIIVNVANIIFEQDWVLEDEEEIYSEYSSDEEHETACTDEFRMKRSRKIDLSYQFPSRRSINRYLEDAAYLNLELVPKEMLNKADAVVTIGLDDATKDAGHKSLHVKSDHITISGPSAKRKVLTTGYAQNIGHSGEDGAKTYEFKLQCLAVLSNTTMCEIKEHVDFWMSDRAGDCTTLLQHLGIDDDRIIKCCAHIILGVDHAIDKVFRETEQKIGVHNLLQVSAGEKIFSSPASSIHTLGLIAIAKLLSPSHASHSVSLYNDYTSWMTNNKIEHSGFTGFVANRFGRIAELAKEFLKRRDSIIAFFDAVVDENSNKLVLAVATFIQCDWFICCAEVYTLLGDLIIFPIMDILGIDDRKNSQKNLNRNWEGVRSFFREKIPELEALRDGPTETGKDMLVGAVLEETIETLNRQLSEMSYFSDMEESSKAKIDEEKLQHAPLTNLGCESEFAKLDNRIRVSGGSTSVTTHSRKNVVATNGLLVDTDFIELNEEERTARWRWARRSDEVKEVKKLEADFLETVKVSNRLALLKKEQMKKKKHKRALKLLEACKEHSGPMTEATLHLLNELNEKQLLAEIGYLRLTLAPDIRQKRRIKTDCGKYKMQNFTSEELMAAIRNVIKPDTNVSKDIDSLLLGVLL